MTTKDKKPTYKVGKAIRKSFVVYDSKTKEVLMERETLKEACNMAACEIYAKKIRSQRSSIQVTKQLGIKNRLAKNLEREFLRNEKDQKKNSDKAVIVKYKDNITFIHDLIGEFKDKQFFYLNSIVKFYAFKKKTDRGEGYYTFKVKYDLVDNYSFKLIDFKPLEQ